MAQAKTPSEKCRLAYLTVVEAKEKNPKMSVNKICKANDLVAESYYSWKRHLVSIGEIEPSNHSLRSEAAHMSKESNKIEGPPVVTLPVKKKAVVRRAVAKNNGGTSEQLSLFPPKDQISPNSKTIIVVMDTGDACALLSSLLRGSNVK